MRTLSLLLFLAALARPALAFDTERMPYHALTRHWSAFEELAPEARDKVRLTVRVQSKRSGPDPLVLWMDVGGRHYDLPVDSYGLVQVPRTPDLIAADPVVQTNQPKGSVDTELALVLLVPDSRQFHYADLKAATDQTSQLIHQAAGGLISLFLPSVTGVSFTCPTGTDCSITLHRAGGDQVLQADRDGKIRLPLDQALAAENPLIEASVPLSDIEPSTE
jgi:hypothetical protein